VLQDWHSGECLLEGLQGLRAFNRPDKMGNFRSEVGYVGDNSTMGIHKSLVKVGESEE
jgi:hypothetical protein